ncbi:MAG TPA: hypothetical protein VFH00_10010 [Candidatus Nitrosotalea sp.]|nr:hypothetical protein [Candidatus Nitrosotalea sp.]
MQPRQSTTLESSKWSATKTQLWIRDTWVPLAATSGLKRIAVVVALHGLARFAVEAIIRLVGATRLDARLFNSPDDAVEWVETEGKKSKTASR